MVFYSWEINISYLPGPRMKYEGLDTILFGCTSLLSESLKTQGAGAGRVVGRRWRFRSMVSTGGDVLGRGFWVKRTLILQTLERLSLGISVRCCRNGARKTNECCFSWLGSHSLRFNNNRYTHKDN